MNKSNTTDYNGVCRFLHYQIQKQRKDLKLTQVDFCNEKNIKLDTFRRIKSVAEQDDSKSYHSGKITIKTLSLISSKLGFKINLDTNYSISHED